MQQVYQLRKKIYLVKASWFQLKNVTDLNENLLKKYQLKMTFPK